MKLSHTLIAAVIISAFIATASAVSIGAPRSVKPAKAIAQAKAETRADSHKDKRACGDIPPYYESTKAFQSFAKAYAVLDSPNFNRFRDSAFGGFGRSFAHPIPQRKLAAQLAIYGYDFIGEYRGYLLFYRRAEGWWQAGTLPSLTAPNGERLPPLQLPSDLNPEWPSPGLVVSQAPFIGAIVLPQQIIAIPCVQ